MAPGKSLFLKSFFNFLYTRYFSVVGWGVCGCARLCLYVYMCVAMNIFTNKIWKKFVGFNPCITLSTSWADEDLFWSWKEVLHICYIKVIYRVFIMNEFQTVILWLILIHKIHMTMGLQRLGSCGVGIWNKNLFGLLYLYEYIIWSRFPASLLKYIFLL